MVAELLVLPLQLVVLVAVVVADTSVVVAEKAVLPLNLAVAVAVEETSLSLVRHLQPIRSAQTAQHLVL
jgi:hypothetical protein